jgi:acyl carrier protein
MRGYRIELGEIESILQQHNQIQEAAVVARNEGNGDPKLVGYIVPYENKKIPVHELRGFLKQQLPDFMIPTAFLYLESMPLTPNGKVDRKSLPKPELQQKETYVKPQNEIERQVTSLWQDVLKLEKIGIHDNFFDLGGHSLNIIEIQTRVKELFNKELSVVDFFKYPSVNSFAKFLSTDQNFRLSMEKTELRVEKQRSALALQRQRMMKRRDS